MNRIACATLSMFVAVSFAGCTRGTGIPGEALRDQVQLVELEPAGNGAKRLEARIVADDRYSNRDHFAALLLSMDGDQCAPGSYSVIFAGETVASDDGRPEKGQPLAMQFTCQSDRLPNHQSVAPGTPTLAVMPRPEGMGSKAGWTSGQESPVTLANRLIGSQVREAYTEECGERPMLVERIDTGTEEIAPQDAEAAADTPSSAGRIRMHVALAFRCLEQPATSDY